MSEKDEKTLSIINDLMTNAINKMDYDDVRPSNEKIDVAPRDSMTTGVTDSDDVDLELLWELKKDETPFISGRILPCI